MLDDFRAALTYIGKNSDAVLQRLWEHIQLSGIALVLALVIALPLGVVLVRYRRLATPVLGIFSIIYTIPSLAMLILLLPFFGLTPTTAIVTLFLYAQVVLVRNVVVGLQSVNPILIEAARGMGMPVFTRWWRVELPLALPIIVAGLRVAAVMTIAIATIASSISAGGLGVLLFQGITFGRDDMIWAGALMSAGLALVVNYAILGVERLLKRGR